jgi:hypothetical protein
MFYLQALVAVFVIGWFFGRRNKDTFEKKCQQFEAQLDFELQNSSDKNTQEVLSRLKSHVASTDTIPFTESHQQAITQLPTSAQNSAPIVATATPQPTIIQPALVQNPVPKTELKTYIDNTSLLLYFGAFLFITAVGLFIGFSEVTGGLKTAMISLVAASMYLFGFWMHNNKKQLKIVGEAFIGIGMTTVPFIGITAYSFGNAQVSGAVIWLVTSLLALSIYCYTIIRLRSTFVSYLLLGGIVSLILSFAGIIDGPVYYYIWAAAATGIVMELLSLYVSSVPKLKEASHLSGQLFIPLTLAASLIAASTGDNGMTQVTVTLGLSSCYYALLALTEKEDTSVYSTAAHVLAILTISSGVFTLNESINDVGIALLLISVMHGGLLLVRKKWFNQLPEHSYIIVTTSFLSVFTLLAELRLATLALVVTLLLSSILAYSYRLLYGYQIALGTLIALSYASGQWVPATGFGAMTQAILGIVFLLPLICLLTRADTTEKQLWKESVRASIAVGFVISIGVALFSGAYPLLALSLVVSLLCVGIYHLDKIVLWRQLEIAFAGIPLLYAVFGGANSEPSAYLSMTTAVLLIVSIVASLRHKLLFARYSSSFSWLLLPIVLMSDNVAGLTATSTSTVALYGVVLVALSISRALAFGKFLLKSRANTTPLTSLTGHGSIMYYFSMLFAACIVILAGFNASNDTVGVLSLALVISYILFHFHSIEKSNMAIALMPFWVQLVLLRFFEPYTDRINSIEIIYPLVSSFIAITAYVATYSITKSANNQEPVPLSDRKLVALCAVYIAPFSIIYTTGNSWLMPFTAIVATALTLFTYRYEKLHIREQLGGTLLVALFWQLYYFGITDFQVFAHLTAALLTFYAYVRHTNKQTSVSDSYIAAALCTATIPLALEALSSSSSRGDMLGLWLLLEQIAFLVIGVTIKKPLLTKWGLYVGIAAVLYQLRDLGWAMVAVLSLFLIGIAIFRALKQPEDSGSSE